MQQDVCNERMPHILKVQKKLCCYSIVQETPEAKTSFHTQLEIEIYN